MNRRKDGIRKCKPRDPHWYVPTYPQYENRYEAPADLEKWAGEWQNWWVKIGEELRNAFDQFDTHKKNRDLYDDAIKQLVRCGDKMKKAGCELLNDLNGVYEPEDQRSETEEGGVITDSTQPPPPPFGKGNM